jgi:hypothetical protein
MTVKGKEHSVPADVIAPFPFAGALSHLRGASAAVERLLADTDPSDPVCPGLLDAKQAIHTAHQALTDCARRSRQ